MNAMHPAMLGDVPPALIPHPLAVKGSLFSTNPKPAAPKPNGGYSNEDRAMVGYYTSVLKKCSQTVTHDIDFTLLSGGKYSKRRRSNVNVIIVKIDSIPSFLF